MKKHFSKLGVIGMMLITTALFSACNQTPSNPPKNTGNKPPVVEDVVPSLKITGQNGNQELKLRSVVAKYENADKSKVRMLLSDNRVVTCNSFDFPKDETSKTLEVILQNKGALQKGTYNDTEGQNALTSAKLLTGGGDWTVEGKTVVSVTDINDAIIRGSIDASDAGGTIKGDYFGAFCK